MNLRSLIALCVACVLALVSTRAGAQDLHQASKDLVSSDKAQVAAAVGYSSGPAFGAAFRSVFGTTPGRSRRGG